MAIKLVIITGPNKTGRTALQKELTIKDLSIHSNEDLSNYTIKHVNCDKECKLLGVPLQDEYLSPRGMVAGMESIFYNSIKNAIDGQDNVILVVGFDPIYYRWLYDDSFRPVFPPVPSVKFISLFVENNVQPLKTFYLPMEKEDDSFRQQRMNVLYGRARKNFGLLVHVVNPLKQDTWKIVRANKDVYRGRCIYSVDGLIAAGKTTKINENDFEMVLDKKLAPCVEPLEDIHKILNYDLPAYIRQEIRENCITKATLKALAKLMDLNPKHNILMERNILYSKWIFDGVDSSIPMVDEPVLRQLVDWGLIIGATYFINTALNECKERMASRGAEGDGKWDEDSLVLINKKTQILYCSDWEWPYAEVMLNV